MVRMLRTLFARLSTSASLILVSLILFFPPLAADSPAHGTVKSLRVTILSTMLSDDGVGEWGFAAGKIAQ